MIAGDDPLIGKLRSRNLPDHVPDGAFRVIHFEPQLQLDRAGPTHVIAEGKRPLPLARSDRTAHAFKDRARIVIREGHRRDGGQAVHLRNGEPLRRSQRRRGGYIRRGRVARILEQVLHRTALHRAIRSPGTVRVFVTLKVAIVGRVGIDDDASGPMLLRQVDLHAAEVHAIARQHNLARDADVQVFQFFKIFRPAVIHVDHIGGDVAGRRGAVESGKYPGIRLVRIVVDMLRAGPRHQDFAFGVRRLHKDILRIVQPCLVGNDLRVQASSLELAGHVDGRIVVFFAGRHVRHRGQGLQLFLCEACIRHREELLIDLCLIAEVAKAENVCGGGSYLGERCLREE